MRMTRFFCLLLVIAGTKVQAETTLQTTENSVTQAAFKEILPAAANDVPFWFMTVDVTAVSAVRDTAVAEYAMLDGATPFGPIYNEVTSDQLTAAPRISIGGTVKNGWGFQTTYWDFSQSTHRGFNGLPPGGLTGAGLEIFGESASSRAYTFDVEATRQFTTMATLFTGTLGARYALLEHTDNSMAVGIANTASVLGPDIYTMSSQAKTGFHGTGLTYSLSGIYPTTNWLSLYGGGRLSNLFGSNEASANTHIVGTGETGRTTANAAADSSSADHLFIFEGQVGLMWHHNLKSRNSKIFARAGFEYQYWNSPDDPAQALTSGTLIPNSSALHVVEAVDLETHFVGFSLGAGYAW